MRYFIQTTSAYDSTNILYKTSQSTKKSLVSERTGAHSYGFNGQEKDDEVSGTGNTMTAEFWEYDTRLGRRWNIDPVTKAWESPYATFGNSPILNNDPLGLTGESTHTDKAGNVLAVYNDGDNGVYKHDDAKTKADVDKKYSGTNTPAGGTKMGETLHPFSFVKGADLENNKITPEGKIDFDSDWGGKKIQEGIDNSYGIVDYALKARSNHSLDIKHQADKDGLAGGIYNGSILFKEGGNNIYGSARDGNVNTYKLDVSVSFNKNQSNNNEYDIDTFSESNLEDQIIEALKV